MSRSSVVAAAASLVLLGAACLCAQTKQTRVPWPPKLSAPAPGEIQILPVQGNVWVLIGAGANITVQAGNEGILVVDTGTAAMSDKVLAAMATISKRPLRYIVEHDRGPKIIPEATKRSRLPAKSFRMTRAMPPRFRTRSTPTRLR